MRLDHSREEKREDFFKIKIGVCFASDDFFRHDPIPAVIINNRIWYKNRNREKCRAYYRSFIGMFDEDKKRKGKNKNE